MAEVDKLKALRASDGVVSQQQDSDEGKPVKRYAEYTPLEKAAILMISVGNEAASAVFKYLTPSELDPLVYQISQIGSFTNEVKKQVIVEFNEMLRAQEYVNIGGVDYARAILERTLGAAKAAELIGRIVYAKRRPFDFLKKADASQIYDFIHNELSQTIALILSYIEPSKAADVIYRLPTERQADVARRIAIMDKVSPDMIRDIERVMERKISALDTEGILVSGGIDAAVEILNVTERAVERNIIESIEETDPELAEEIKKRMFVFEDIILLDDRSIQRVLQEVDHNELAKALKGTPERVSDKIFENMSKRAGEMLREEIEYMGPVRLKEVEEVQQKIVGIIRKLEEQGEVTISRGEQETFV